MVVIHSPQHQQIPPPIVQNCEYQVKIDYGTFQCMTGNEYIEHKNKQRTEITRGTVVALVFVVIFLGFIAISFIK